MNRKGQQSKKKNQLEWMVVALTCPTPHWAFPIGGLCTYSRSRLWSSNGTNPLWFRAGWMQCCCRALVCFAPTLSIPFHPRLVYISFPHQRILKQFFRCLLWGQLCVVCDIFYHTKVSLYSSFRTDSEVSFFCYKITSSMHHGKIQWQYAPSVTDNVSHRLRVLLWQGPQGGVFVH